MKPFLLNASSLDLLQVKGLFLACKWDWLAPDLEMSAALTGSFRLFGCAVDGQLVGFARLISDGKIYGLLIDFMVHPGYRRRGIGKALSEYAVNDARKSGLKIMQLLASKDGVSVYQQSGFISCPPSAPGMVKFL